MKTYALYNDLFFREKSKWMPQKLYRVVCYRANPRSKEYMLHLLNEMHPGVILIDDQNIPEKGEQVILLYPDSIGLGWGSLEKRCLKHFRYLQVLNGRKRFFKMTMIYRLKLLANRFLEITFLPELVFAPLLLIIGFLLVLKDKLAGCS